MLAAEPTHEMIAAAVYAAVGRSSISIEPVWAGFSHRTFRVHLEECGQALSVRFPVRDLSTCQREQQVMALADAVVPLPEVLLADLDGALTGRPVLVCRWVDGIALDDAVAGVGSDGAMELGRAVGQVIADMSRVTLPRPGWFTREAIVEERERSLAAGIARHVRSRLFDTEGGRSLPKAARDHFWSTVSEFVGEVAELEECASLVHGDFACRNIVVAPRRGGWMVAAVLDWEFALSGPSLLDVGHVLRYWPSQPPEFEHALANKLRGEGVVMSDEWRRLAWLLDAVSLTGPLARPLGHPDRVAVSRLITEVATSRYPWRTN